MSDIERGQALAATEVMDGGPRAEEQAFSQDPQLALFHLVGAERLTAVLDDYLQAGCLGAIRESLPVEIYADTGERDALLGSVDINGQSMAPKDVLRLKEKIRVVGNKQAKLAAEPSSNSRGQLAKAEKRLAGLMEDLDLGLRLGEFRSKTDLVVAAGILGVLSELDQGGKGDSEMVDGAGGNTRSKLAAIAGGLLLLTSCIFRPVGAPVGAKELPSAEQTALAATFEAEKDPTTVPVTPVPSGGSTTDSQESAILSPEADEEELTEPEGVSRSDIPPGHVLLLVETDNTLWEISQAFGTNVEILMALNGIDNPRSLQIGQELLVPTRGVVASELEAQIVARSEIEVARSPQIGDHSLTSEGWYCEQTNWVVDPLVERLFLELKTGFPVDLIGNPIGPIYWSLGGNYHERLGVQFFDYLALQGNRNGELKIFALGLNFLAEPAPSISLETRLLLEKEGGEFFSETGHVATGAFLEFFNQYGGVDIFGPPITEQILEEGEIVQWFSNCKMRLNASGEVELIPLGREYYRESSLSERFQYDWESLESWRLSHPDEWQRLSDEAVKIVYQQEDADSKYQLLSAVMRRSGPLTYDRVMLILYGYHVGIEQNTEVLQLVEEVVPAIETLQYLMDEKLNPGGFSGGSIPQMPQSDLTQYYLLINAQNWQGGEAFFEYPAIYGRWWELTPGMSEADSSAILYRVAYTVLHEELHRTFQFNTGPHPDRYSYEMWTPGWNFSHMLFDLPVMLGIESLDLEFDYKPIGFPILLATRLEEAGYEDPLGMILRVIANPLEAEQLLEIYAQIRHTEDPDPSDPDFFNKIWGVSLDEAEWERHKQNWGY